MTRLSNLTCAALSLSLSLSLFLREVDLLFCHQEIVAPTVKPGSGSF